MDPDILRQIRIETRENQSPYFEDEDIEYYFNKNEGDVEATIYELLVVKSEDSTISVSGLSTGDTSAYFRRLASKHRKYNSGVLTND
jgi:hypothetical protein